MDTSLRSKFEETDMSVLYDISCTVKRLFLRSSIKKLSKLSKTSETINGMIFSYMNKTQSGDSYGYFSGNGINQNLHVNLNENEQVK